MSFFLSKSIVVYALWAKSPYKPACWIEIAMGLIIQGVTHLLSRICAICTINLKLYANSRTQGHQSAYV